MKNKILETIDKSIEKKLKEIESECWDLPSHITRSQRITVDQLEIIKNKIKSSLTSLLQAIIEENEGRKVDVPTRIQHMYQNISKSNRRKRRRECEKYNQAINDINNKLKETLKDLNK